MFEDGLNVRRQVLGGAYVDASLAKADDFMAAMQRHHRMVLGPLSLDPARA
jgi:hypothetical protein